MICSPLGRNWISHGIGAIALLCACLGITSKASAEGNRAEQRIIEAAIETPAGTIYKVTNSRSARTGRGLAPSVTGDTYDIQHLLGFIPGRGETAECLSEHLSGMDDNTVLFDGLTELTDPLLDGTQPGVFEFETPGVDDETDVFVNSFAGTGEDLFPEGFEDPETGTPLDAACLEIGIDDTLDADIPVEVTSAVFEASGDSGTIFPPTDITSFFSSPWDGRLSVILEGLAGEGINGILLELTLEPFVGSIFADGFESGDTSSWTSNP